MLAAAARDTLGAAVEVAAQLEGAAGAALLALAREAFVEGMHVVSTIAAAVAVLAAITAVLAPAPRRGRQPAAAAAAHAAHEPAQQQAGVPAGD
jgi:MFS transporter, DHA2 family, multidrug resistance protein